MTIKTFTLATAAAALLSTGAIAQNSTTSPADAPATPPAVTQPATPPAAAPSMTEKKPITEMKSGAIKFSSTLDAGQLSVNKLIGMTVYNSGDENLGDVNDVIVEKSGNPSLIIVGVGGFLGIGEKNVGVPFDRLQFAMNKDNDQIARLDVTREALENAPGFVYTDEPDRTAATRTN